MANIVEMSVPATSVNATAAVSPATTGCRLHHRSDRANLPIGRATIGSPRRKRPNSAANSAAV
ncbi:MAG: hypothetical protein ACLP9L_20915 [Thermoguttaceae bacterium]